MGIRYINGVPGAPDAIGPYSQAVVSGNQVYLSGQIPLHPELGEIVSDCVEQQTEQVMKNIIAVLGFMNIDFSHVVKTSIFLADMADFPKVNNIYAKWMGQIKPARATVAVKELPKQAKVEIQMDAILELDDVMMMPHRSGEGIDELGIESYQARKSEDQQ